MNPLNLAAIAIPLIMQAVQIVQGLTGMTNVEKSAVVLQQVSNALPPEMAQHPETITRIQGWINTTVSIFNLIHPMFKKTSTSVGAAPVTGVSAVVQ